MWHKLMDALLESDTLLAAKRTADIKRYTVPALAENPRHSPGRTAGPALSLRRPARRSHPGTAFVRETVPGGNRRMLPVGPFFDFWYRERWCGCTWPPTSERPPLSSPLPSRPPLSRNRPVWPPVRLRVPFSLTAGARIPPAPVPQFSAGFAEIWGRWI